MIKAYCVAGHTFHLQMQDDAVLWHHLGQYDPFVTDTVDDPLFTLSVVPSIPEMERTVIYSSDTEDEGQPRLDMYSCDGGYLVEMAPTLSAPVCGTLFSPAGFRRGSLCIRRPGPGASLFAVNNSLMLLYAFCTASLKTLEMHSSVVMNGGKGYMFLGKSGTGKSTHSSLWLKHIEGSELMNDDNPVIRIGDDGVARVYGSPWSGKTPCYRNVEAPIGAVVRIRQAPFNAITRQSVLETYASIYSSCSGFKADAGMADGLHESLEFIALNVPCYTLDCLPDEDAAKVCSEAVMH